jgi:hypothetical protein
MSRQAPLFSEKSAEDATYDEGVESSPVFASWFGGKGVTIGPRIGPVLDSISDVSSSDESSDAILTKQREIEDGKAIQYRTCSWQKVRSPSHPWYNLN